MLAVFVARRERDRDLGERGEREPVRLRDVVDLDLGLVWSRTKSTLHAEHEPKIRDRERVGRERRSPVEQRGHDAS
jgi:hypothetical protein